MLYDIHSYCLKLINDQKPPENNGSIENLSETGTVQRTHLKPPSNSILFMAAAMHPQFRMLICDIPDRYREIVSLYERSYQPGQSGYYPYLQIQACLDMSKFLTAMWACKFNGPVTNGAGILLYAPESKGIADIASNIGIPGTSSRTSAVVGVSGTAAVGASAEKDRIILQGGLGASRVDVSSWVMKAWASGIEYLTLSDQIMCVTAIATVYAQIGYRKKHSFFLRQTALLLLATLRGQGRSGSLQDVSSMNGEVTDINNKQLAAENNAVLQCMRKVFEAYDGSDERGGRSLDDDDDEWIDEYFDDGDLEVDEWDADDRMGKKIAISRLRYGWPDLQIDVLRECMDVAEVLEGWFARKVFNMCVVCGVVWFMLMV